jgi:hypothetical protein
MDELHGGSFVIPPAPRLALLFKMRVEPLTAGGVLAGYALVSHRGNSRIHGPEVARRLAPPERERTLTATPEPDMLRAAALA